MKRYSNPLYGDIPAPENFNELIEFLAPKADEDPIRMWRGQSNIAWRLDHAAYRRLSIDNKNVSEDNLLFYEESLLDQATHKGYRLQDGRMLSDFELLAKLQHHGAATRLLDFTRNGLIALWFCACKDIDKPGLLIGLHSHHLGGGESVAMNTQLREQINSIKIWPHPQTWEPPVITPRVAAQHSQFIYSALSNDERSSITLSDSEDANLFVAISPKMKIKLLLILEKAFDIRYQTLFPDVDGFSTSNGYKISIDRMWRW